MRFTFSDMVVHSGIMKFRFPSTQGGCIYIDIDIVNIDIPLLLWLRELHQHKLLVYYILNTFENKDQLWTTSLHDMYGHLFRTFDRSE